MRIYLYFIYTSLYFIALFRYNGSPINTKEYVYKHQTAEF